MARWRQELSSCGENSTNESKVTFFSTVIYSSFEGSDRGGGGGPFLGGGGPFFTWCFSIHKESLGIPHSLPTNQFESAAFSGSSICTSTLDLLCQCSPFLHPSRKEASWPWANICSVLCWTVSSRHKTQTHALRRMLNWRQAAPCAHVRMFVTQYNRRSA